MAKLLIRTLRAKPDAHSLGPGDILGALPDDRDFGRVEIGDKRLFLPLHIPDMTLIEAESYVISRAGSETTLSIGSHYRVDLAKLRPPKILPAGYLPCTRARFLASLTVRDDIINPRWTGPSRLIIGGV